MADKGAKGKTPPANEPAKVDEKQTKKDEEAENAALEEGQEEESEIDENQFPLIGKEETPEQRQQFREYLKLLKEIEEQNNVIAKYKDRIKAIKDKKCKTDEDEMQIECIKESIAGALCKLDKMAQKAIRLQNTGSRRQYQTIILETSPDD